VVVELNQRDNKYTQLLGTQVSKYFSRIIVLNKEDRISEDFRTNYRAFQSDG